MANFNFDDSKKFSENCASFLKSVKDIDAEMAEILEANWDKIAAVVSEGERDPKARVGFNESIAQVLDGFLQGAGDEESD